MKENTRKQKPISLDGCQQVFKQCNIPFEEYSQWDIYDIFKKAEELANEHNLLVDEVYMCLQ